jgi:hypothetical protein
MSFTDQWLKESPTPSMGRVGSIWGSLGSGAL